MIRQSRQTGRLACPGLTGRLGLPSSNQAGFSLLELLVAFSIMAISLGLLYRVAGGSVRQVSDTHQHQQATWLAESLLASRQTVHADGWNESGESGGFQWQVRSIPHATELVGPKAIALHEIQIEITWPLVGRTGRLETVTLLPEQKSPPGAVR
jgi:general secretion pathway protein I